MHAAGENLAHKLRIVSLQLYKGLHAAGEHLSCSWRAACMHNSLQLAFSWRAELLSCSRRAAWLYPAGIPIENCLPAARDQHACCLGKAGEQLACSWRESGLQLQNSLHVTGKKSACRSISGCVNFEAEEEESHEIF